MLPEFEIENQNHPGWWQRPTGMVAKANQMIRDGGKGQTIG